MKPGRELDAEVAKYIIGYECVCEEEAADCPIHAYDDHDTLRPYSTDLAAAFSVNKPGWLWEFEETPETLTVTLYPSPALRRRAIAMFPILPKDVVLVRREWLDDKAQTYAWLRCLAALEAVGVKLPRSKCIYISESDGSDQNDGLSPETAKFTLEAALRAIEAIPLKDDIVITLGDDTVLEDLEAMGAEVYHE